MYRNRYSNRNEECYYKNVSEEEVCLKFRSAIFYVVCSSTISEYYEPEFSQKGKKIVSLNSHGVCKDEKKSMHSRVK